MKILTLILTLLISTQLVARPNQMPDRSSNNIEKFDRIKHFGDWKDADKDCLNTRHEVLQEESLIPVEIENCKVTTGLWVCPMTGKVFTNPKLLDVDHIVPLKEAYVSGARYWTKEERVAYANYLDDPGHLVAVSLSANRSKGDKDPGYWLPLNIAYWPEYIASWKRIKKQWNLNIDKREQEGLKLIAKQIRKDSKGIKIRPGIVETVCKMLGFR